MPSSPTASPRSTEAGQSIFLEAGRVELTRSGQGSDRSRRPLRKTLIELAEHEDADGDFDVEGALVVVVGDGACLDTNRLCSGEADSVDVFVLEDPLRQQRSVDVPDQPSSLEQGLGIEVYGLQPLSAGADVDRIILPAVHGLGVFEEELFAGRFKSHQHFIKKGEALKLLHPRFREIGGLGISSRGIELPGDIPVERLDSKAARRLQIEAVEPIPLPRQLERKLFGADHQATDRYQIRQRQQLFKPASGFVVLRQDLVEAVVAFPPDSIELSFGRQYRQRCLDPRVVAPQLSRRCEWNVSKDLVDTVDTALGTRYQSPVQAARAIAAGVVGELLEQLNTKTLVTLLESQRCRFVPYSLGDGPRTSCRSTDSGNGHDQRPNPTADSEVPARVPLTMAE